MKTLIITLLLIYLSISSVSAQNIDGKLTVNDSNDLEMQFNDASVVDLFKRFKTGKYKIVFFFEGDYQNKDIIGPWTFFKFRTTVKHNGNKIATLERKPMPYIPGDMFLGVETFDFINALATYRQEGMSMDNNTGKLPEGKYEIVLEATPVEAGGSVQKATMHFNIN